MSNINLNTTYFGVSSDNVSTLFGSLSKSSTSSTASMLSDYASIRNGSYGKLIKSYYAKTESGVSGSTDDTTTGTTGLTSQRDAAKALKESATDLWEQDKDSVFNKTSITNEDGTKSLGYDMDSIYKAVSKFAEDYNNTVSAAGNSNTGSILNTGSNMTSLTKALSNSLKKVGITVGVDNKLTVDETAFKKADINNIKSLFSGTGSYAYQVSTSASQMANSATSQMAKLNGSLYTSSGSYTDLNTGSLYTNFT